MRLLIAFILIASINYCASSQNDTSNFITFLNEYKSYELPFYSYLINSDKEFNANIKKKRIDDEKLMKYFIKDSSEFGYKYTTHEMDNYNVTISGYIKYRYYFYNWLKFNETVYFIIYVFEDEDISTTFLLVFSAEGKRQSKITLSEELLGVSFTESYIDKNLSIKKVTYSKSNNNTLIETNTLKFNIEKKCYELFSCEKKEERLFYYDFKKHNLLEDPLKYP